MLGGLAAHGGSREIRRFQTSKTGVLLATLAYDLQRDHSREELQERIWPEADSHSGRRCLSQAIYSLRLQLEPPGTPPGAVLIANHSYVRLNPPTITTDIMEFEGNLRRAETTSDINERCHLLDSALAVYKGDLLPGYFEDWVLAERERLANMLLRGLRQCASTLDAAGDTERALEYTLRAMQVAPLVEEVRVELMQLYAKLERNVDVMSQYEQLTRMLHREEGRRPSASARAMAEAVKSSTVLRSSRTATLTRQRTSTIDPPAHTPASRPSPAPTPSAPVPAPQLPMKLTRFFGRDEEITRLMGLLAPSEGTGNEPGATRDRSRLVTLVGPGGSGKTRLAVEVAERLIKPFAGSVYYVALAEVKEAVRIEEQMLEALGVTRPAAQSRFEAIVNALASKPALLVVDNLEHLGDAAGNLLWKLLENLPQVSCLVTSRQQIGIDGEQIVRLQPLSTPSKPGTPERLMEFASVQLFVDRAQAVFPEFQITPRNAEAIAAVCDKLEGIPLAIELAAARAPALTPAQMLKQLEDRFNFLVHRRRMKLGAQADARHDTLRGAIEWSYLLLSSEVQLFFARLSTFRGGWTLEAAQTICDPEYALEYIEQLLERSLIVAEPRGDAMRYRMLETLREYAAEHLSYDDRQTAAEKHTAFYLKMAEEADSSMRGSLMRILMEELTAEHDNLRSVLDRSVTDEKGLRMAGALRRFWLLRGISEEGRRYTDTALSNNPNASEQARILALIGAGAMAFDQGDYDQARLRLFESEALCIQSGNEQGKAETFSKLGMVEQAAGSCEMARKHHETAYQSWLALKDDWGAAAEMNNLGRVAQKMGDLDEATRCYRESRRYYEQCKDWVQVAIVQNNLGAIAFDRGELAQARAAYQQSLELFRKLKSQRWVAVLQSNLSEVYITVGDYQSAKPLLCESLEIRREMGDKAGVVRCIAMLGTLARCEREFERAAHLLAAAKTLNAELGIELSNAAKESFEKDVAGVRFGLDPLDFKSCWDYGLEFTMDRAIGYALDQPIEEFADYEDSLEFIDCLV